MNASDPNGHVAVGQPSKKDQENRARAERSRAAAETYRRHTSANDAFQRLMAFDRDALKGVDPDVARRAVARFRDFMSSGQINPSDGPLEYVGASELKLGAIGIKSVIVGLGIVAAKDAESIAAKQILSKVYSSEKQALVAMAKSDKKIGVTRADMEAYRELNRGLKDPFPANKVRTDPGHTSGLPSSQVPHGHIGEVNHIPILDP